MLQTLYINRFLILELVIRTVKLRYRGSILGYLWTMLNPLFFMLIYSFVFVVVLNVEIDCYPVFIFAGLLPWTWFAESVSQGCGVFIAQAGFLKNAVFPGEILPLVTVFSTMVNFLFAVPILLVMLLYYGRGVTIHFVALPVIMAVHLVFCVGLVFILATYNVFFRDVEHLVGLAIQALFFLTPVFYDVDRIPVEFRTIFQFSPTTILISSYRSIFFYQEWPNFFMLFLLLVFSLLVLQLGQWLYQNRRELVAESL